MYCIRMFRILTCITFLFIQRSSAEKATGKKQPNIVIFVADDVGIGDIGCFGNSTIKTPNIDSICTRGVKLSQHLAADAVCTPSRAAFLTGRMAVRSGMGSNVRFPVLPLLANPGGLPPNETTFAKILQNNGYRTALIGKWHQGLSCEKLGDHCHHPNNHGFDYFFGLPLTNYKNLGNDSNVIFDVRPEVSRRIGFTAFVLFSSIFIGRRYFGNGVAILMAILFVLFVSLSGGIFYTTHIWNSVLMRNEDIVEQPVNLNDRMAERLANEGIRFLSKQSADRPFLLMMSWLQAHSALHASQRFRGHSAHGAYGDEIEEIDWSVGQVLKALEYFNYLDNSIIYFTSDNGGHLEEHHGFYHYRTGGYNGIFRGGKGQGGQDGGIRMPSAIMWPGKIPSGKEVTIPTSQMDLFPTILAAACLSLPNDRIYDGTNILRWLTEENVTDVPHKFLFHNCGTWLHAIRYTPDDGSDVFKIYYYWPMWQDNVDACADFMCTCAQHHLKLDVPKITNIARDPREIKPLDQREELYREILKVANKAKKNYEQSLIEVKNQISGSPGIHLKLLTCCSWGTMCQCNRDDENALKYTLPWK